MFELSIKIDQFDIQSTVEERVVMVDRIWLAVRVPFWLWWTPRWLQSLLMSKLIGGSVTVLSNERRESDDKTNR